MSSRPIRGQRSTTLKPPIGSESAETGGTEARTNREVGQAVTGIGWLDWLAVAAFVAVTALSLARLVRRGDHFRHDAFHAVMGVAMTAMFWPGGEVLPIGAWVAVLGLIAVWPVVVFARAARAPRADTAGSASASPGRAGYYLASALVMVVAFGAGQGSMASGHPMAMGSSTSSPGHAISRQAGPFAMVAGWPIWPLIGVAFLLYGAWLAVAQRRRQPTPELACTVVMAAGMAVMAFSI
jgi:hypothetical protein